MARTLRKRKRTQKPSSAPPAPQEPEPENSPQAKWFQLFEKYPREGPYRLQFIETEAEEYEPWIEYLKKDEAFLVFCKENVATTNRKGTVFPRIALACKELSVPYLIATPELLECLAQRTGHTARRGCVAGVFLLAVKEQDRSEFEEVKKQGFWRAFVDLCRSTNIKYKRAVRKFVKAISNITGTEDPTTVQESPIVVGGHRTKESVLEGKAKVVIVSSVPENENPLHYETLRYCYLNKIPFVVGKTQEAAGKLFRTASVDMAYIAASGVPLYDMHVDRMVERFSTVSRQCDCELFESNGYSVEEAKSVVEDFRRILGKHPLPASREGAAGMILPGQGSLGSTVNSGATELSACDGGNSKPLALEPDQSSKHSHSVVTGSRARDSDKPLSTTDIGFGKVVGASLDNDDRSSPRTGVSIHSAHIDTAGTDQKTYLWDTTAALKPSQPLAYGTVQPETHGQLASGPMSESCASELPGSYGESIGDVARKVLEGHGSRSTAEQATCVIVDHESGDTIDEMEGLGCRESSLTSGTSNATNGVLDLETLRLEEEIAALEASMRANRSRRQAVNDEKEKKLVALREAESRKSELIDKNRDLLLMLAKQTNVQEGLQIALQKSRRQLRRLESPDISLPHSQKEIFQHADEYPKGGEPSDGETSTRSHRGDQSFAADGSNEPVRRILVEPGVLRCFWENRSRCGSFLPCVDTKELILSILRVAVLEVLETDLTLDGWEHRRQSMWNTCLDARMLVDQSIDLRSDYGADDADVTGRERHIDLNVQLCPYELSGECHDEACAYQHLQERHGSRLLPREFLPLPRQLLRSTARSSGFLDSLGSSTADRKKATARDHETGMDPETPMNSKEEIKSDGWDENLDYVSLPILDSPAKDNGYEARATVAAFEEKSISAESFAGTWLTRKVSASVSSLVERDGFILDEADGTLKLAKTEGMSCIYRVVSCFCFLLHAGRYDLTRSLMSLVVSHRKETRFTRSKAGIASKLSLPLLQILETMQEQSFAEDATGGLFIGSFELQSRGVVLSLFFQHLRSPDCKLDLFRALSTLLDIKNAFHHASGAQRDQSAHGELETKDLKSTIVAMERRGSSDEAGADVFQDIVQFLLNAIVRGRELRKSVAHATSIRLVISDVLPLCMNLLMGNNSKLTVDRDKWSASLAGIFTVSNALLGAIQCVATRINLDSKIGAERSECLEVYTAVDKILQLFSDVVSDCPSLELIITPLHAAHVSLASTMRMYDKAQQGLEALLASNEDNDMPSLSALSELLWSQLIQLESSLPRRCDDSNRETTRSFDIPPETLRRHEVIADNVVAREVHPHHVTLENDWNLTECLGESFTVGDELFDSYINILKVLPGSQESAMADFALTDWRLSRRQTRGTPSTVYHLLPQSLLLVGASLSSLHLTRVGLDKLPYFFGRYFRNLKVRALPGSQTWRAPRLTRFFSSIRIASEPRPVGK